ncbi:MAG: DNA recombination protein RmuC [Chloroflexota bacterium]|nr:DNA recombination protein RmuC [Chloroflexota bacterium]
MTALIVAVVTLSVAVIVLTMLWLTKKPQDYTQAFTLLQQRVGQIEEQVKRSVDEGSKAVGEKFESSLKVIGEIKETLGGLKKTNEQMLDIGKDIASLQDLLKPPQVRGGFGESTLGSLLANLLPKPSYQEQYRFKSGSIVDALVTVGEKCVPIDSKFPLESFQRYMECAEESDKKSALKEFERNVKSKIDDIATKYILTDEGTYDFALMYIPSENVYYQTIIKADSHINGKSICDYAWDKRVVAVSPNSLYAYLSVICMGLRGMQFQKNVRRLADDFDRLNQEFGIFTQEFAKLGAHLGHARDTFDRADQQLDRLSGKLTAIREAPEVKAIQEPDKPAS